MTSFRIGVRIAVLVGLVVITGCQKAAPPSHLVHSDEALEAPEKSQSPLTVITVPPTAQLDQMRRLYSPEKDEWLPTVDVFIENGHPILRYIIDQLVERNRLTAESATTIYERIDHSRPVVVNGQRALSLMEICCYADLECHPIEYPLRKATLNYVTAHLGSPGVKNTLEWIRKSYRSDLQFDDHEDPTGEYHSQFAEAMQYRMVEYAIQVLSSAEPPKKSDDSNPTE